MTNTVLKVTDAVKSFGGLTAVDHVSFEVGAGEIYGIAGPNGSGKSTLFNLITGIPYRANSGEIQFEGQRIESRPAHEIARRGLGRTFQKDAEFPDLDAEETVLLGAYYAGAVTRRDAPARIDEALSRVGFDQSRRKMKTSELSIFGKKQLMIASALASRPKVLLLDEPASGLTKPEIAELDRLLRAINEDGTTILLIEHVLTLLLSVSQHLLVLNHGSVLARGVPKEVIQDPAVIEAYLGGRHE